MSCIHRKSCPALVASCLAGFATIFAGCSGDLLVELVPDPNADPAPGASPGPVTAEEVLIRFRNFSQTDAVNVEFFASNAPLAALPDDLFVDEHRTSVSIGVAGTGILQPLRSDEILFPCTADLVIGTTGGTFIDDDSGEVRGEGDMRWSQDAAVGLCGRRVTFGFGPVDDDFITRLTIGQ